MPIKLISILFFLLQIQKACAQYTMRLIVTVPAGTDNVFVAGTFNNWNPGDKNYKLIALDRSRKQINLHNLRAGRHEFKFTRGIWSAVESTPTGQFVYNRIIFLQNDTTLHLKIAQWADTYIDMSNLSDSLTFDALWSRADYYLDRNQDSSYKYALKLYELSRKLNSNDAEYYSLTIQGAIFARQGNRSKALEMFFKALSIIKQFKEQNGITNTYQSIASIYEDEGDFVKAKETYLQSLQVRDTVLYYFKRTPLTKIGQCYFNLGRLDSAKFYLQEALNIDTHHSPALLLMGDIQMKTDNRELALTYYRKALYAAIYHANNLNLVAESYKKIGVALESLHQNDSALYYARKSFAIAKEVQNPMTIISSCYLLMDLFKKEKRFDSAFLYQANVLKAKDSLFTQEKERQIHNVYFNETLRQREIKAQAEKYQTQIKLYIFAGVLALLLFAGLGYWSWLRSRFHKQLFKTEMRALRAQMNPHFIFNCLASINRYIVKSDTKTASVYLTKFSKLIRMILDNSSNEYISLDTEILTLKLYLDMELLRFNHSFDYEIQQDSIIDLENIELPTMVIQPYVENAIWHGLLHKEEKGKLWIRFLKAGDGILQVEIEDNGVGRNKAQTLKSKETLKTKSYGMQISKDRIQIINKQYNIHSTVRVEDLFEKNGNAVGTKVILHLPCHRYNQFFQS